MSSTTVVAPSDAATPDVVGTLPGAGTEPVEQRLRRLEDAVASMQDTSLLEQRILERLQRQMVKEAAPTLTAPPPVATPAPPPETSYRAAEERIPPEPPVPELPLSAPLALLTSPRVAREAWLLVEVWRDLKAMVQMFFDMRYRVGWFARILTFVMVPLLLLSYWWVPLSSVLVIGGIWNNVVVLVLSFFLFKVLTREARRYQQARER